MTTSGKKAKPGMVSADPRYWEFGDCIELHHPEPIGWKRYIVEDTGGSVKGPNRFDVVFLSTKEADQFGIQKLEYRICTT